MFDWTVMIYFGGDNNLGEEMIWAIKDIQAWRRSANHDANIKVCALFDAGGPPVLINDDILAVYRAVDLHDSANDPKHLHHASANGASRESAVLDRTVAVRELEDRKKVTRRLPPKVPPVKKVLSRFIEIVFEKFAAERYMLVLAGHGSGAVGDFLTGDKRVFGLTIPDLGDVLTAVKEKHKTKKKPKPIDILGMDSCQMSMAEVACQVEDAVHLMVGTEGFQPNAGWPYEDVLGLLSDPKTAADPGQFAEAIVKTHITYYLDYASADLSTDMSVINLDRFDIFQHALQGLTHALGFVPQTEVRFESIEKLPADELAKKLVEMIKKTGLADSHLVDAIVLSHWRAQGYKKEQYIDLWDFCDQLSGRLKHIRNAKIEKVYEACERIKEVIEPTEPIEPDKRFIRLSGYSGPQFQHSHGISVFFPWASLTDAAGITDLENYQPLKFAKVTAWDEFIRLYLYKTQREVREQKKGKLLPSLINRRTGLFAPLLGRDPEDDPLSHAAQKLGVPRIESMKNPPIEWKKWEAPSNTSVEKQTAR